MNFSHQRSPSESSEEYGRGIAGGLLFSIPLLYTVEVWQAGIILAPARIIASMAAIFCLLMVYNRYAGLREDASLAEVAIDSVEELGIGLALASAVLWLTGRIDGSTPWLEVTGMVVTQAMTVAIGVSVGTAQLGAESQDGGMGDEDRPRGYVSEVAIAFCGAVLFAANVAPTREIQIIAYGTSPWRLLALAGASLALVVLVLHYAGFRGTRGNAAGGSAANRVRGVITAYAVALVAAAASLWFFGRMDGQPLQAAVAQTAVLGLPAALGASAGRLLLQSS